MKHQKKPSIRLVTVCLLLTIFSFKSAHAQTINPQFISISDGLASTTVQAIHQDQYGLLWVGTTNGLQKYDGISFKTYKTEANQPNSLINNDIWGIEENENGDLWIATRHGISKYDRENDTFVNYDFNEQFNLADFDGGGVFNLFIDSQNRLWAVTIFAGALLYNPDTDRWEMAEYQLEGTDETNSYSFILAITEDPSGRFGLETETTAFILLLPATPCLEQHLLIQLRLSILRRMQTILHISMQIPLTSFGLPQGPEFISTIQKQVL